MVMMKSDSLAVEISAGRGPVFDLLTSLDESPILKLKAKKAEVLSSPPVGIGTRWRETRMGVGKEAVVEVQITQFLPPKFVALEASTPNATYFLKVSLEDAARLLHAHLSQHRSVRTQPHDPSRKRSQSEFDR